MRTRDTVTFDRKIRQQVYEFFLKREQSPTASQVATALRTKVTHVKEAYRRLADAHKLVLQQGTGEILMANPLSAVPTNFQVDMGKKTFWGNCIWDALGIPAMLDRDGRVRTACACCNDEMILIIRKGSLVEESGIIHFAVPAKRWWDNIVFT